MSGGHFNHNQYLLREIAQKIEEDIAIALKPKPEKVHENYWTIEEKDNLGSCRSFGGYMTFDEVFLSLHNKRRTLRMPCQMIDTESQVLKRKKDTEKSVSFNLWSHLGLNQGLPDYE